jgi:hypothetical protein
MNTIEQALAKGLCLQLIIKNGYQLNIQRPTLEEAKQLTASYRPWYIQLTSMLFFKSSLQKVNWDLIIDNAISPEIILEVYQDCLEAKNNDVLD